MALRAVHGNRVEALLDALLDALPPADPFTPSTIVVGSHLVTRWLMREIALARGIAAGLEVVTFDAFVEQTWTGAGLAALDQRQLAAALASVLADERFIATLPAVAAYMTAAPDAGDRAGPRRVQFADHLAELAWQYALSRPDWMPAIAAGQVPPELAGDDTARWQVALIGAALRRTAGRSPVPMLPWARRRAKLPPPKRAPIAVFGVSFLHRAQLEALTDLAATTDVTVYLLDPCAELWDDVSGRSRPEPAPGAAADPLPLALWGGAVKATLGALVERTGGDLDAAFVEAEPQSARERLLADVLHRRTGQLAAGDHGVEVLACPDPRREIEIVAAAIRARLDADPTLSARDVAVWIASHAERYLAQAPAAFEAVGVPWHLIDAPLDDRGRIGEAALALLELPTSSMARRDLLRVMTHPAVLAAHPHVNADDWVRWTERLGIVHGADQEAHANTYLADHPGHFHWDQGVQRLALGAFMVGVGVSDRGPASIGGREVAPEEVRPEHHASAATYALLVRSLCADSAWLAHHQASLAEWASIFVGLVDAYLGRPSEDAARDVERVRSMLAGIAHVDLDGRRVGFREAREHAQRRLVTARRDRGEPLAHGVMVAPLRAQRAVPFRVAYVVGLAEGGFPAGDQPSALDLRREPRAGDIAPRDRDRHAFLEVLLGTREALALSYVATEPKGGQPLGPSSVVLELADALAPYLGAPSSREALDRLTRRFPLHRFAAGTGELPPAVARERWGARIRDAVRAHLRAASRPIPDEDGMLALLAHDGLGELRAALGLVPAPEVATVAAPSRPLSLANVRAFLDAPVQAWAQAVLGLDELPDEAAVDHSDEPYHVDKPARAILLREVLAAQLHDPHADPAERYEATVRQLELRGQFPVGVFGEAARTVDLRLLESWRGEIGTVTPRVATRLAFGRSSSQIAELLPALELALPGGRTIRLIGQTELLVPDGDHRLSVVTLVGKADKRSRYHLRGALDHVVLSAAGLSHGPHAHLLLDPHGTTRRVDHAPWAKDEARAYLAGLVAELLDAPHGYLLPFDHLVTALAGGKAPRQHGDAPLLGFGPIDRIEGLAAPPDAAAIAQRRLLPLVRRMKGDHGLGGDT